MTGFCQFYIYLCILYKNQKLINMCTLTNDNM